METGNNILLAVLAFFAGALVSFLVFRGTVERLRRRVKSLRAGGKREERKRTETMKKVVWVCLANGFAWVWCSYVLAFLDKMQIAESLSQVAVTQIIGVVLVYGLKSAIENLSKNNHWPDKPTTLPTGTADVISDASGDGTTGVG